MFGVYDVTATTGGKGVTPDSLCDLVSVWSSAV